MEGFGMPTLLPTCHPSEPQHSYVDDDDDDDAAAGSRTDSPPEPPPSQRPAEGRSGPCRAPDGHILSTCSKF